MRRRAEVELEYSRGLDKLVERFSGRGGRLGGSSREHQSFRWVLGPGSWDGQGGGRGGLTPTPGRSEPRSPPPHPQEGAVPAVALALLGCVVAADSAAEPGKHSSQRGAGRAPGPAPELHCRGCGAPGQEGKTLPWAREAGRPQDPARAARGCSKPKCQEREGPGGQGELVGAWSAELRAGGMDVGVALGQGGTQLASSPE